MAQFTEAKRKNLDGLVKHRRIEVDGVDTFYREAGRPGAPVLLLPHGYPSSSVEFRGLMACLGNRYHLLAPDFPGQGLSATPEDFDYSFAGYSRFLEAFAEAKQVRSYTLYLHDFGTWIGLRLAMRHPGRVTGLVIQNGDIYEDAMGPKYAGLKAFFADRGAEQRRAIEEAVSLEGFKEEFLNELRPELAEMIAPDLWHYHWSLVTARRKEILVGLITSLDQNIAEFPRYQAYLREHRPPTLIVWGPQDGYMPAQSARAYLRDLPEAELHLLDAGHWALETSLDQIAPLIGDFMDRVSGGAMNRLTASRRP
jgi:pimeloyl-ACP methyl ester carboxylesterase